jgi:hypothetical protein
MTQTEQDAIVGRVVRERKEVALKIETLKTKAAKQGSYLKNLGTSLELRPELVAFTGPSVGADALINVRWSEVDAYPLLQDVVAVGNELRETLETQKRLEEQAIKLGV